MVRVGTGSDDIIESPPQGLPGYWEMVQRLEQRLTARKACKILLIRLQLTTECVFSSKVLYCNKINTQFFLKKNYNQNSFSIKR